MTDKYSDLKKAAEAATPGPWECREAEGNAAICHAHGWVADDFNEQTIIDTRYMALANPATVLALLADLDEAQLELSGVETAKKDLAEVLGCADEPRWKWLYCNASELVRQNEKLKAEAESLRKDAARYRWTATEGNWVARMFSKWRAHTGSYGDANPTDWYDSRAEAIDAAMTKEPQS